MYVIDNTVFIHLQKCAGTSVGEALKDQRLGDLKYMVVHQSLQTVPEIYNNYRKIALVRSPLTWYKSFYEYNLTSSDKVSMEQRALLGWMDNKEYDFDTYLERALNFKVLMQNKKYIDKFRRNLLHKTTRQMSNFHPDANNLEFGETLYQYYVNVLGIDSCETFQMEKQMNEVLEILKLDQIPHSNKSLNDNIITETQKQRIITKDKILFEKWGYEI